MNPRHFPWSSLSRCTCARAASYVRTFDSAHGPAPVRIKAGITYNDSATIEEVHCTDAIMTYHICKYIFAVLQIIMIP